MATISDYDRVESFTRNLYRNMLCHDSYEYEWMQKTAMAGHLMAMGAPKTTVLSAFLSRVLIETQTDVLLLAKFLDVLDCDGDKILDNVIDITATHRYEYRPLDLIRKSKKDGDFARHHLFLTDLLFKIMAYNRINVPLEKYRSEKARQYVSLYGRVKMDSLSRDLLKQIKLELSTVEYLQQLQKVQEKRVKEEAEAKVVLLNDRVKKEETDAYASV